MRLKGPKSKKTEQAEQNKKRIDNVPVLQNHCPPLQLSLTRTSTSCKVAGDHSQGHTISHWGFWVQVCRKERRELLTLGVGRVDKPVGMGLGKAKVISQPVPAVQAGSQGFLVFGCHREQPLGETKMLKG